MSDVRPAAGHLLAAVSDDGGAALVARLARTASEAAAPAVASFHCIVLRLGRLPLVIAETALASATGRWEFRTSGLWVELVAESPPSHWSYGLEAFALALDDPCELLDRGYGHRTPLGWELDFESDEARLDRFVGEPVERQEGRVDGLLLAAPEPGDGEGSGLETPFAGPAERLSWTWSAPVPGPHGSSDPSLDRWRPGLPAPEGPPVEVALPLGSTAGGRGQVWWVGHDGTHLTSRWTGPA